jgi:hypothetical protein
LDVAFEVTFNTGGIIVNPDAIWTVGVATSLTNPNSGLGVGFVTKPPTVGSNPHPTTDYANGAPGNFNLPYVAGAEFDGGSATVPEPGSLVFAGVGMAAFFAGCRRRRR